MPIKCIAYNFIGPDPATRGLSVTRSDVMWWEDLRFSPKASPIYSTIELIRFSFFGLILARSKNTGVEKGGKDLVMVVYPLPLSWPSRRRYHPYPASVPQAKVEVIHVADPTFMPVPAVPFYAPSDASSTDLVPLSWPSRRRYQPYPASVPQDGKRIVITLRKCTNGEWNRLWSAGCPPRKPRRVYFDWSRWTDLSELGHRWPMEDQELSALNSAHFPLSIRNPPKGFLSWNQSEMNFKLLCKSHDPDVFLGRRRRIIPYDFLGDSMFSGQCLTNKSHRLLKWRGSVPWLVAIHHG
jgi:hypothetical protein